MQHPDGFVLVGRVRKVHGLRGELVIETLTDAPDAIFAPGRRVLGGTITGGLAPVPPELVIRAASAFRGGLLVAFDSITDRDTAEKWRDRYLLVPQDEVAPLAEGELYLHELDGMRVVLADGTPIGVVDAWYELPHGLVLDVKRPDGTSVMLQYQHMVTAVDREGRVVTAELPEGLLD
jgi:16S rRNA processing protein RimM